MPGSTSSLWGAQAAGLLVTAASRHQLPCSVFATDYTDFETRWFPNSLAAYPCDFAFYVADPHQLHSQISKNHHNLKSALGRRNLWMQNYVKIR